MNQAEITRLVSRLRFKIQPQKRKFGSPEGPMGRLNRMRSTVTALIKYERIEANHLRADEARGYAERLLSDAIRHGDQHAKTMDQAKFWITEEQYIHKLFKVLVPRFQNCPVSYTRMYKAPKTYPDCQHRDRAVLELRGNPYPALKPALNVNRNFIHNVLLDEAKKEYRKKKYAELNAESTGSEAKIDPVDEATEKLERIALKEKENQDDKKSTESDDVKPMK